MSMSVTIDAGYGAGSSNCTVDAPGLYPGLILAPSVCFRTNNDVLNNGAPARSRPDGMTTGLVSTGHRFRDIDLETCAVTKPGTAVGMTSQPGNAGNVTP